MKKFRSLLFCILSLPLLLSATFSSVPPRHEILVIGTGYVGLVLGACLADFGHTVTCCDTDEAKIEQLNAGGVPIYEEGLEELLSKHRGKKLFFSAEIAKNIKKHSILFIAVGTPSDQTGRTDLSAVEKVAKMIGENLNGYKTIFMKSTVPIGTNTLISNVIAHSHGSRADFDVAYAPEFLREGSSIHDFCEADRVILGVEKAKTQELFCEIFEPLQREGIPFLFMNIPSAEVMKYASNAYLAVKLSFVNELADFCEITGANIADVTKGMGLDQRIGPHYLNPGPGYGGSCLPKDTSSLLRQAETFNAKLDIIKTAVAINQERPFKMVEKLSALMGQSLEDKTIALLGLSFKENTDDVRESPVIKMIETLLRHGVKIQAYDPIAMGNMKKICGEIDYCHSIDQAVLNADAIILATAWDEFRTMDLSQLRLLLRQPLLLDLRNCLQSEQLVKAGFKYANIGLNQRESYE